MDVNRLQDFCLSGDVLGSLTPGKYADFVVLSCNIMQISAPEILETEVVATYLGGKCIYGGL